MADRNQSQKRNLAEAAFRINYTALYDVLAQPLVATGLAVKLYSAAIITSETRDAIQTLGNPPARQASWLLQAVEASIKSDYTRLRKFTRVLRKQPVLEPIAKQLHQRYSALVSEARLTESSSSGSDTDSTEQHQSRATASLPAATSVYSSQQGAVSLEDYTKRNLKMIQRKFTKLQQNACEVLQLKLNAKEMKKLHLFLVTILPHGFTECLPKSSDLMDIFEAMTHNDLWNHSNYFPLESLIEEFGGDTELTTKLEQFKMDRSSFQIATKIKDYIPAAKSLLAESDEPVEPAPIKSDRKYLWKLGVKLDECVADESLEYLDELWRSLAKTLRLPPVSLVLQAIVEKSILVVWLIPAELGSKAIEIARQSAQFFHSYPILSVTIGDECVYEKEIKGEKKLPQSSSFAHEMQVPRSPSVDKSEELPPMPPAHLSSTTTELNLQAMPSENEVKSAPPILPHVSKPGQHPGMSPKDTEINISGNGIPGGPSSQPPQTPPNKMQHETLPTGAQTQPTSKCFTPVPQTPGTCVKEGALPRLLNLLSPVVHSWSLFALQIGVPTVQISQIQAANLTTNPKSLYTCLTQALEWWIVNHHNPIYEVIISVLDPKLGETTPVMNRALAREVREFMAKEQSQATALLPGATNVYSGPIDEQVTALSLKDVNIVRKEIHAIRSKWQDIALELGMSLKDADDIDRDFKDDKQCLLQVLRWWLNREQPKSTWSVLIESLRSCTIEEHTLADYLQRKYCPQAEVPQGPFHESATAKPPYPPTAQQTLHAMLSENEVDVSGNEITGDLPQTPSNSVPFETPPVSPGDAQTQPTRKRKAQEPVSEVKQKIDQLEQVHRNLADRTFSAVKQQSPNVEAFRQKLTLLPTAVNEEYHKYLKEILPEIYSSKTIDEVFGHLNLLLNYLSFGLLQYLIQEYGDEKMKQEMEEYSTAVQTFREETPLHLFLNAQPKRRYREIPADLKCRLKEVMFKHKNFTMNSTLSEVELYRQQLACDFSLPDFTIILEQIEPGSLSTVWLVPASVAATMKESLQSKHFDFFQEHEIIQMRIDGRTVYPSATAEIEISDLEFEKKVGEGGTGTVYKGHWKSRGLDVAIKTTGALNKTEVEHLSSLDHPNIVSFYGGVTKMPDYYIVTEFVEHGSLHDYLQMVKFKVDYEQRLKWAMQIAKGMNYLHEMKIMHRDLKPHNVLITEDLTAKICDFSAAKTFEHTTAHTMTGTFRWIAPEVLKEEPYSLKCDVFSFGMILYELIACKEPFSDSPALEAVSKIRNGEKPAIPDSCEPFLSNLLTMCWKEDPKARPTFAEIVSILENKATAHEIEISDLEFERKVGEGGTGTVYKGYWKSRGLDVAIKTTGAFNKAEVEHLSSLNHPNIILPYGVVMKMPKYYIVTEFAEHGSLHDYLHETKFQVDYKQRLKWAKQVAEGMNYLHTMKIMHRDLKPHNVLVSKDLTAKICDFGAAKRFEHTTAHTMTGTFRWIAPEVLNEEPYSLQCDVFSFGMILYELIACKEPFSDIPAIEVVSKIRNGEKPDIPSTSEVYLSSLLTRCWEKDPKARPTFAEIVCTLDSKGFYGLSKIFLQSLKIMVDSMDKTIHTAEKVKSALSSLTLQLHNKEVVPLVDSAAYQEARTIPELMKSMSPYWNCLSTGILNCVIDSSECSASASALHDFKSARDSSSYLILVAQASTASSGDQKALHPLRYHSEKLQSYQPAVFARLAGHQLCASVNVTQISVTVDKAFLHLTDYDHVTEAVVAFLQLPVAALVYCGCSENPLTLFWEVSRELVGHISSVVPASFQQYCQLLENNITTLCVSDELKYSCPNMKHIELWAASSAGHADKILDLLKCVTVDVVDFAGLTALVYASLNGHSQAVKALIAEDANVNHQIKVGYTPLFIASTNGHTDVAELLLNNGAKVNLQEEDGVTPLSVASQNGHSETVQLLLSRGANVNLQEKAGSTPLFMAAQNGHTKTADLLINGGADVNLQKNTGATPLYMASQEGHSETVQLLLSRGANINLQAKDGNTPLIMASWNGQPETVELLIRSDADINTLGQHGWTPLICAAVQGHEEVAERLLTLGANPNILAKNQETAVMWAARNGHVGVVTRLLQHRANIKITNKKRETALDIATRAGHTKICEELRKYC